MNARGPACCLVQNGFPSGLFRVLARSTGLALALLLGVAASPAQEDESGAAAEPSPSEESSSEEATFRIGVGDVLDVYIYEEEAREECVVRPDGRITLPLIGDVPAAGATPPELARRVTERLEPFQESPTVTVAVREIHSYKIYVLGEVAEQQRIESASPLRLLEALAIAGGFNEFAKKEIMVLRGGGDQAQRFEIDYEAIVEEGSLEDNLRLESGDVVVVK
jgi:polysaccharide export outer membrane protein